VGGLHANRNRSTSSPTTGDSSRYNERLVTSLRLSSPMSATGSPSSLRGKRFSIPTILEAAPPDSPGPGGSVTSASRGMKRGASKTLEELGVLSSNSPRHAFEKHRPKSFTLAPTTPLTPAILSLFDGQLPSEHYTINHIMQASPFPSLCPPHLYRKWWSFGRLGRLGLRCRMTIPSMASLLSPMVSPLSFSPSPTENNNFHPPHPAFVTTFRSASVTGRTQILVLIHPTFLILDSPHFLSHLPTLPVPLVVVVVRFQPWLVEALGQS
jgi:hypothetical protein